MSTEVIDPRVAAYARSAALQDRLNSLNLFQTVAGAPVDENFDRDDYRVAIVAGRWHVAIVDALVEGALETLNTHGVKDDQIDFVQGPGAFEFPLIVDALLQDTAYNAVIVLGVVIKGETPHFDFVAGECASGISRVSLDREVPIGFGLLTVNTVEQAFARSQPGESNKGREAVLAALEVADLQLMLDQEEED